MKAILLLIAIVAIACAPALVQAGFVVNTTYSDPDRTLSTRTVLTVHNVNERYYGFRSFYFGLSDEEIELDTLGGFVSYKGIPIGMLMYWSVNLDFTESSFKADGCANLMAKAFYQLQEKDADGNVVETYGLGGGAQADPNWVVRIDETNPHLKVFKMEANLNNVRTNTTFNVQLTFFLAAKVGTIDLANTHINPRQLESVLRISGYPYADPSNHLTLKIATVHRDSTFKASGALLTTGENLQQLYVKLADHCHVVADEFALTGEIKAVTVAPWKVDAEIKAIIDNRADIKLHLTAGLHSDWGVSSTVINFPAGAQNIVYDPTLGASAKKVTSDPGAASAASISTALLVLVASLLAFLL